MKRLLQRKNQKNHSSAEMQTFKFILQNAASKLRFSKLQSSNSIFWVQSPLFFYQLVQLKFSKTRWKRPKLYKRSLTHFQKMSLARWFWPFFFWKKSVLPRKLSKNKRFSSICKMKANETAKSFPIYRILVFFKFDSLDPTDQTSKKREFDRLEKPLWNIKSFISPESSRTRCKLKLVLKFRVSMM